ncbi:MULTISPECIES: RNA polymerase sigma factor [unclassified Arcicella]|uniref:RNA polymerase sigma factor n=1 Tax=unclassified Arcicella TaxID=2644986 RepID=UPI00285EACB4|nr:MULTISPECIES: RNA polymerase sigma factor [unclassified Arcicella]MDR6564150.1 RNA polymerase sigma-70 factor (ECF subfamily) [Arcicella sp. BE51]MDR6813903.1 RNA polymerase sigma-70 factor (ECF subfamily) [Arcicella sp. BE140]MDR6825215.1 RNA polymerase sigma-70 factor (ECF subfamily) [Arcicella sp. BE139]
MENEEQLIQACLQNDRNAQRKLYNAYAGRMLVVCARYMQSKEEAEDVLQEAFIKIFQNLSKFRGESTLGAWIKRIVINVAINHIRAQQHFQGMDNVQEYENQFTDGLNGIEGINFQELIEMIRKLPKGCQSVFNLYAIEGYQHKEIAEMLNITEGTSKSQYARARAILQSQLSVNS